MEYGGLFGIVALAPRVRPSSHHIRPLATSTAELDCAPSILYGQYLPACRFSHCGEVYRNHVANEKKEREMFRTIPPGIFVGLALLGSLKILSLAMVRHWGYETRTRKYCSSFTARNSEGLICLRCHWLRWSALGDRSSTDCGSQAHERIPSDQPEENSDVVLRSASELASSVP